MEIINNLLKYKLPITTDILGFEIPDIVSKGILSEKKRIVLVSECISKLSIQENQHLDTLLNERYESIYIYFYGYYLLNKIKSIDIEDKKIPTLIKIKIAYDRGYQIFKSLNILYLINNQDSYTNNINTFQLNLRCYITFLILYHYIIFFKDYFKIGKLDLIKSNLEKYQLYPFWVREHTKGRYLTLNDLDSTKTDEKNVEARKTKIVGTNDKSLDSEIISRPILDKTQTELKKTMKLRRQYSLATKESKQPRRSRLQNNNEIWEEIYCGETNHNYPFFQQSKNISIEQLKTHIPDDSDSIYLYGWVGEFNLFKMGFYNNKICPDTYPLRTSSLITINQDINSTLTFSIRYLLDNLEFKLTEQLDKLIINDILNKIVKELQINIILLSNDNTNINNYINNIENKYYFLYYISSKEIFEPIIFINETGLVKFLNNNHKILINLNVKDDSKVLIKPPSSLDILSESPSSLDILSESPSSLDILSESPSSLDKPIESPYSLDILSESPSGLDTNTYVKYNILDINSDLPVVIINQQEYLLGKIYNKSFRNIYEIQLPFKIVGRISNIKQNGDQYNIKLQWTSNYKKEIKKGGSLKKINLFNLLNKS